MRIERLTDKRNRRTRHEFHLASPRVIELFTQEGIGALIFGKNDGWEQEINLGQRTNQNFAPFCMRVSSKCAILDLKPIERQETYPGRWMNRGLFISPQGRRIQMDVNGKLNILRREFPCVFEAAGINGTIVRPVRLVLAK